MLTSCIAPTYISRFEIYFASILTSFWLNATAWSEVNPSCPHHSLKPWQNHRSISNDTSSSVHCENDQQVFQEYIPSAPVPLQSQNNSWNSEQYFWTHQAQLEVLGGPWQARASRTAIFNFLVYFYVKIIIMKKSNYVNHKLWTAQAVSQVSLFYITLKKFWKDHIYSQFTGISISKNEEKNECQNQTHKLSK